MSSRTTATGGTSSSNRRAPPTTTPANVASGRATPATQPTRRPRSSSNAAASSSSVAVNGPKPLFGVEIEIFVKLRPELERAIYTRRQRGEQLDEAYWRNWNFALSNERGNQPLKDKQRECVGQAIEALIEGALGPTHGWKCVPDASLKEWALTEPPETRKWCMFILATSLISHISRTNCNHRRGN